MTQKVCHISLLKGCIIAACLVIPWHGYAQTDSTKILAPVKVVTSKRNVYTSAVPAQTLSHSQLEQLNAVTVGDAAKSFTGVLLKDYGGIGGLKTISVRSLGAMHTNIIYDGIAVADAQNGQVDLGKFSTHFVDGIELDLAEPQQVLQPARNYAAASELLINSPAPRQEKKYTIGTGVGSWGYKDVFAGVYNGGKTISLAANGEVLYAKGDYPFIIQNGTETKPGTRSNADITSYQGTVDLGKLFRDNSRLQVKTWAYASERGLPGAVIFFNDRSVQRLQNNDWFTQASYKGNLFNAVSFLVSAKYADHSTQYTDPDFLNGRGGLDNRYRERELYGSAALSKELAKGLTASLASDVAAARLTSNLINFLNPGRLTTWNSLHLRYEVRQWQLSGTLLQNSVSDKTNQDKRNFHNHRITPSITVSFRPAAQSPFLLRAYYKNIYRVPTFNDLYYSLVGNNNLKPEDSRQYNVGVTYQSKKKALNIAFSADGYYNFIENKIIAVPSQNLFVWRMLNLGRVSIKGIDVSSEVSGGNKVSWYIRMGYSYQQALDITDKTSTTYKNQIPYSPEHSGSVLATVSLRKWSSSYYFLFSGTRYFPGGNNAINQLNGWGTHDISLTRKVFFKENTITLKAEVNNFTNERYDVVRYYPMPGRSFKTSLIFTHK